MTVSILKPRVLYTMTAFIFAVLGIINIFGTSIINASKQLVGEHLFEISALIIIFMTLMKVLFYKLYRRTKQFSQNQRGQERDNLPAYDFVDCLSMLPNLHGFENALQLEISRCDRFHVHFTVLMLNIDNFRCVNDAVGRINGDTVIKDLSARLRKNLRSIDLLARTGGDEFMLLLPHTDCHGGMIVGHKLHNLINGSTFKVCEKDLYVTASIGVVSYPLNGNSFSAILQAVASDLRMAKMAGKNHVSGHYVKDIPASIRRKTMVGNIRHAITEGRIELFLQPIVSINGSEVFAYEALARVRENGAIFTAESFIEQAESIGVVKEIDACIFKKGVLKLRELNPETKMFFNFSPASFADVNWMMGLPRIVSDAGVACNRVVIEITEREFLPDLNKTQAIIKDLRLLGFQFALDDFGSGFSSFLYMRELSVNYLKIDGGFISNLRYNKYDNIIVTSIQQIAQSFGLQTIAEFVEDEETASMLHQLGIDFAQGYHFGRPSSAYQSQPHETVSETLDV